MKLSLQRLLHIVILLLLIVVSSCSTSNYSWGWYELSPFSDSGRANLSFLFSGFTVTIVSSLVAFLVSIFIGFIIAFFSQIKVFPFRFIAHVWVLLFRSIPVLVMLLWLYYGLAIALGINLTAFVATIIGLSFCQSAFQAEVFRTGIESIPKSQIEAAQVYGANIFQIYGSIIIPQMFRQILPTLANQFVYMLKISSIASVIGLSDLTRKVNELTVIVYRPLEIYTLLILEYLVLISVFSYLVRVLEKKIERDDIS